MGSMIRLSRPFPRACTRYTKPAAPHRLSSGGAALPVG
jgi:hypothetical protein